MSRENATTLLDGWLNLTVLKPYEFRKAITYFLRAQGDYNDELQLQKFAAGIYAGSAGIALPSALCVRASAACL